LFITGIHLGSFGKYQDRTIKFDKGINIIYGDNEKGKSTIHKFIESMLFGLNTYQFGEPDYRSEYFHYLPWNNNQSLYGELDFDDNTKSFHIEQNYLKDNGIKVFMDGKRIGPYRKTEDDSIIKSHEHKILRVLGISNISSSTGTALVEEMQEKILNIKATNSGNISVEKTNIDLKEKIYELENARELIILKEQREYYLEQINLTEINQRSNQQMIIEYYETIDEADIVQQQIDELNIKLTDYETFDFIRRYNMLKSINKELNETATSKGKLAGISDLKVEDVESFVQSKNMQQELDAEKTELNNSIRIHKIEVDKLLKEYSLEAFDYVDSEYNTRNISEKLEALDALKARFNSLVSEVDEVNERIVNMNFPELENELELKSKEKKLDEDYQRFLSASSWKNRIIEEKGQGKSSLDIENEVEGLNNKYLNMKMFSLVMQILGAVLTLAMFAKPILAFLFFIGIVICIVSVIVSFLIRKGVDRRLMEQEFLLKNIQDEVRRNKDRLYKATRQLEDITEVYNAKSEAEFVAIYEERKVEYGKMSDLIKENDSTVSKSEDVESEFNRFQRELMEELFFLDFGSKIKYTGIKRNISRLISSNLRYRQLLDKVEKESNRIKSIESALKKAQEIETTFSKLSSNVNTLRDYQLQREKWVKLSEQQDRLIKDKDELVSEFDEEYIVSHGEELIKKGNYQYEDITYDIDEIKGVKNEKVNKKEELLIKSSKLKAESEHVTELMVPISKLQQKYKEINSQLFVLEDEIDLYKDTLIFVEAASRNVYKKFKNQLRDSLHGVIHQVIGEQYEVSFDEDMKLLVKDLYSNETVDIKDLSQGTMDQIHFALRIGLISSMEKNINIPLVLDDCFVHYDGGRLEQMLLQISKLDRQVIMLTCHTREEKIFSTFNVPFNYIEL